MLRTCIMCTLCIYVLSAYFKAFLREVEDILVLHMEFRISAEEFTMNCSYIVHTPKQMSEQLWQDYIIYMYTCCIWYNVRTRMWQSMYVMYV